MPIAPQKTKSERLTEVINLLKKIYNMGIEKTNEDFLKFKEILTQWLEDGQYKQGSIKMHGQERILKYELYTRQGMDIEICLKYKKGV